MDIRFGATGRLVTRCTTFGCQGKERKLLEHSNPGEVSVLSFKLLQNVLELHVRRTTTAYFVCEENYSDALFTMVCYVYLAQTLCFGPLKNAVGSDTGAEK
jgi:hypothetical protein